LPRITKANADEIARASAALFAALGDQKRLWLVYRLCGEGPVSITRLASGARITRQAVTKHLRVMEHAGLVQSSRRGRERVWQLDLRKLEEARRYLNQISAQWDQALERLRALVEE
jgi:DNA-binding transcriptional ArsR family regulator